MTNPITLIIQNEQEASGLLSLLDIAAKTGGIKDNIAGAAQAWANRILQAAAAEAEREKAAAAEAQQNASFADAVTTNVLSALNGAAPVDADAAH